MNYTSCGLARASSGRQAIGDANTKGRQAVGGAGKPAAIPVMLNQDSTPPVPSAQFVVPRQVHLPLAIARGCMHLRKHHAPYNAQSQACRSTLGRVFLIGNTMDTSLGVKPAKLPRPLFVLLLAVALMAAQTYAPWPPAHRSTKGRGPGAPIELGRPDCYNTKPARPQRHTATTLGQEPALPTLVLVPPFGSTACKRTSQPPPQNTWCGPLPTNNCHPTSTAQHPTNDPP